MRRPRIGPFERGAFIAYALSKGEPVSTRLVRELFGVSRATAKRDVAAVERLFHTDLGADEWLRRTTFLGPIKAEIKSADTPVDNFAGQPAADAAQPGA